MKPYTLVVVDMQAAFPAAKDDIVIEEVIGQIEFTIANNLPIMFLEYIDLGSTIACVRRAAVHYKHKRYVQKLFDDGSREVMWVVASKNWPLRFRVCGVNTNACVRATALGLADYGRVVVYLPGCNDSGEVWPLGKKNCFYTKKQVG
jgi:nicotinamidase-related amidase